MNNDCSCSRHELYYKIQVFDFQLVDIGLYLDTHPTDIAALDYYHRFKKLKEKAVDEYTANYGPLTKDTVESTSVWTWIDKPWPWEMEA